MIDAGCIEINDVVIPIVFPDYLIVVNTPPTGIRIPDLIPFFDIFPDVVRIPATNNKIPELGHAGVLFIRGSRGTTKYYEYGRYDRAALGLTRRVPISNVKIIDGEISIPSLKITLGEICVKAGKYGRISGVTIQVPGKFEAMLSFAKSRVAQNRNARRQPYDIMSNSCIHFVRSVIEAAGAKTSTMFDPRPNSYIEELRDMYPKLDFRRGENTGISLGR